MNRRLFILLTAGLAGSLAAAWLAGVSEGWAIGVSLGLGTFIACAVALAMTGERP